MNNIFVIFFGWYFAEAPGQILRIGKNFAFWSWHFFSIGYLIPRLFDAWHRDLTPYGRGFDIERILRIWSWNLTSRLIGAVMRLLVMGAGTAILFLVFLVTALIFIFWYLLPLLIPGFVILGVFTLLI